MTSVSRRSDAFLIIAFSLIPLALHFPYRVNIFLSWEGAYRLYLGEVPYRDFGVPMGVGYWLLPAVFFKLFGPSMLSLIKAQVVLNIIAGLSFRSLLRRLDVPFGVRVASVLVLCLSYILVNFWPWYNNTDILYGIVGINLLLGALAPAAGALAAGAAPPASAPAPHPDASGRRFLYLLGAAFFLFLSFFTKQDGGFLMFAIAAALVVHDGLATRRWNNALLFFGLYVLIALVVILPFTRYTFGYWFNHGQPPHTARLSPRDMIQEFLEASQWIKFYLLLVLLIVLAKGRRLGWKAFWSNRREVSFLLVTVGILGAAAVFQVTSYTPPDNNIFFHAFAIAYVLDGVTFLTAWAPDSPGRLAWLLAGVLLWWSGSYWKYIDRISSRIFPGPAMATVSPTGENVINEHTYMINLDTTHYEDESTWEQVPDMPAFKRIYMPPSTVAGIQRLRKMPEFTGGPIPVGDGMMGANPMGATTTGAATTAGAKAVPDAASPTDKGINGGGMMPHGGSANPSASDPWAPGPGMAPMTRTLPAGVRPHVLNMSELTPLARELNFTEDKGPMEPLWYHLGVCMFNREADTVCARIARGGYDLVLFEYVPGLNNFYPFRVRDSLKVHYVLVDSFLAPRRPTNGVVEVYRKK
ncbi:hypothetical protein [Dinghuibacter silviterrae]|uniref:4-amino-4-deoxy-L-arabinose transferase-like glycosyltransferase n=1 Tax=Dinghuibacter silviterrae TaxID=1539049 RepID=A0A4R8DWN3_9BACT|nr:hypothetical protein [Dinghuibacter silviterrae]TDX01925.1 hypothetical protein EDB95_2970 [Dinghuibacter silviterrae]